MDARRLNLQEAFSLASILSKHIDLNEIKPQEDAVDFISRLIDRFSPEEYLSCVALLTGEDENTIKKAISLDVLTVFIEGLKLNQVVSLIHFYKSLGI